MGKSIIQMTVQNGCGGWVSISKMMSLRVRRSSAAVVRYREAHCPVTAEDTQNCPLSEQITPGSKVLIVNSYQETREMRGVHPTMLRQARRQKVGRDTCCVGGDQWEPLQTPTTLHG